MIKKVFFFIVFSFFSTFALGMQGLDGFFAERQIDPDSYFSHIPEYNGLSVARKNVLKHLLQKVVMNETLNKKNPKEIGDNLMRFQDNCMRSANGSSEILRSNVSHIGLLLERAESFDLSCAPLATKYSELAFSMPTPSLSRGATVYCTEINQQGSMVQFLLGRNIVKSILTEERGLIVERCRQDHIEFEIGNKKFERCAASTYICNENKEYEVATTINDNKVVIPSEWKPNQSSKFSSYPLTEEQLKIFNLDPLHQFFKEVFNTPLISNQNVRITQNIDHLLMCQHYQYSKGEKAKLSFGFFGTNNVVPRNIVIATSTYGEELMMAGKAHPNAPTSLFVTIHGDFMSADEKSYVNAINPNPQDGPQKQIFLVRFVYSEAVYRDDKPLSIDEINEIFTNEEHPNVDMISQENKDGKFTYILKSARQVLPMFLINYNRAQPLINVDGD